MTHDSGVEDSTPYLVLERLRGRTLKQEIVERGALPWREAVDVVRQAALGLAAAHAQQILHRDIKAANIFLVEEPHGRSVKLLDFGIAKLLGRDLTSVTLEGTVVGCAVIAGARSLGDAYFKRPHDLSARSLDDARTGTAVLVFICALLVALVPVAWSSVASHSSVTLTGSAVAGFLLARGSTAIGELRGGRSPAWLRWIVFGLFPLVLLVATVFAGVVAVVDVLFGEVLPRVAAALGSSLVLAALVCFAGALLVSVALGFLLNLNGLSPHAFYRDRIADTFLKLTRWQPSPLDVVIDQRNLLLSEAGAVEQGIPPPLHLIQATLNLGGSDDLTRRDRRSDTFLFSRLWCGSRTTGYVRTTVYRGGRTLFATALAISGAAASSAMGVLSSPLQAFVMTLFNVRLGAWLRNPRCYYKDNKDNKDNNVIFAPSSPGKPFRGPPRLAQEGIVFWPRYLALEPLGKTSSTTPLINLTDGGHSGDNLGLLPLLERRCGLVWLFDNTEDPALAYSDLWSSLRTAEVELGVTIELDTRPLQRQDDSLSPTSYVVGRIRYPSIKFNLDNDVLDEAIGWLLYTKLLLPAHATDEVKSFRKLEAEFPHTPTIDQFFGDDRFEAYRKLGAQLAGTVLDDAEQLGGTPAGWYGFQDSFSTRNLIAFCADRFARQR